MIFYISVTVGDRLKNLQQKLRYRKNFSVLTILSLQIILSGCQSEQIIRIPANSTYSLGVTQKLATAKQPATFYLCDNKYYPCSTKNYRHLVEEKNQKQKIGKQPRIKMNRKHKSVLLIKQLKEKQNESSSEKNRCSTK